MAKGEKCRITNCENRINHKGTVCGTHKWRMKKFNSYDLPTYSGKPNYYVPFPELPNGIVKNCNIHGYLKEKEVYNRYYKGHISSRYCKKCTLSSNIKRKYKGMNDLYDYENMLKIQNGVCAICKRENTQTRKGEIKRMAIDHCHNSLKVRGLLCAECNSLLGYAEDSIEILESAIHYLKKNKD